MAETTLLISQIRTLEAQLRVLYAQVKPSVSPASDDTGTLASLEGLLQGQIDHTEAEIDAILYQTPPDMDENE